MRMLDEIGDVLRSLAQQTPPNLGDGLPGLMRALRQGGRLASLSMGRKGDLLDLFTESRRAVSSMVGLKVSRSRLPSASMRWWATTPVPTARARPMCMLHHVFGEVNGKKGAWGHAIGGMGAITQAMAKACAAQGVEILTASPVRQVLVDGGKAAGVELADGRRVAAAIVASNVNPSLLFLNLVAPADLPPEFLDPHRALSQWLGHVPHERRPVGAARFHLPARHGDGGTSSVRHHHRSFARLHGRRPGATRRLSAGRKNRSSKC